MDSPENYLPTSFVLYFNSKIWSKIYLFFFQQEIEEFEKKLIVKIIKNLISFWDSHKNYLPT